MALKVEKISSDNFGNRGKWNQKAIIEFLKNQHKSGTAIAVNLKDFYSEFYNGTKVIKYIGYYSRVHIIDALRTLKVAGIAEVEANILKVRFD